MKFIGHLDMMRYFQKAMRRADVDIRYSEGFSPHQIMSFAAPLGVGITSNGEYLDIEVLSTGSSKEMVKRLNDTMAEGITVVSYRRLDDTARNAMAAVSAADYTLAFRPGKEPEDINLFFDDLMDFLGQEKIVITKKTKNSEREVDLKPLIYKAYRSGDLLFLQLCAGSTNNVKPELVIEAFCNAGGVAYDPYAIQIQREEIYTDQGKEGSRHLVPLEDLGYDIE